MTDRPILFSGPMVRALLDGRKTQTRRVLKPQPPDQPPANCHPAHTPRHPAPYLDAYCGEPRTPENPRGMSRIWHWWQVDDRPGPPACKVPYAPGDRLWVREAWRTTPSLDDLPPAQIIERSREAGYFPGWCPVHYEADEARTAWSEADWPGIGNDTGRFRQGMHMPKPLSRLTLTVTDVRVQRVQNISERDAITEGIHRNRMAPSYAKERGCDWTYGEETRVGSPVSAFAALWNSINSCRGLGWDVNPWVVAITFDARHCNIDQTGRAA